MERNIPADTVIYEDKETFLTNKKINVEYYALLLSYSKIGKDATGAIHVYIDKKDLPTRKELGKRLRGKSEDSIDRYKNTLIKLGYLVETATRIEILNPDRIYLEILLETVLYFIDVLKEDVLKCYIYLGQRFKYTKSQNKPCWEFTYKEIGEHLGYKMNQKPTATLKTIENMVDVLMRVGVITVQEKTIPKLCGGKVEYVTIKCLTDWRKEIPQN